MPAIQTSGRNAAMEAALSAEPQPWRRKSSAPISMIGAVGTGATVRSEPKGGLALGKPQRPVSRLSSSLAHHG